MRSGLWIILETRKEKWRMTTKVVTRVTWMALITRRLSLPYCYHLLHRCSRIHARRGMIEMILSTSFYSILSLYIGSLDDSNLDCLTEGTRGFFLLCSRVFDTKKSRVGQKKQKVMVKVYNSELMLWDVVAYGFAEDPKMHGTHWNSNFEINTHKC